MKKQSCKIPEQIAAAAVLLFCEWFFFRNILPPSNGALVGDRGDGRLTMLLTNHWWNFFTGKERISEIAIFYPADALGFSDLFLGYGLIYSIYRWIGINMFTAYKWTLCSVHLLGTVSMYVLLKRKLHCGTLWSLFGTLAFCFSNIYAYHLYHTQMNAVSFLPLLLTFFIEFVRHYDIRSKRNLYAGCFILWFILLSYTAWYIACFTGLFCLILLVVYAFHLKAAKVKILTVLIPKVRLAWKDLLSYLAVIPILYIPFMLIYLPVFNASAYSYETCALYMPEFADLINVTADNWMLGGLIKKLGLSTRGYSIEVIQGYSIVFLALFFITLAAQNKHCREAIAVPRNNDGKSIFGILLQKSVYTAIITGILLTIRLSANGVSLWRLVYTLIPVVRSTRAVGRFLFWLSFPMSVITAYTADRLIQFPATVNLPLQISAVILIFLSNITTAGVTSKWTIPEEWLFLSNVSEPPADLESFYMIDSSLSTGNSQVFQTDAFAIAEWYDLKTINGYSGNIPAHYGEIENPESENYEKSIYEWVELHNLKNVYAYDRATNTWIPFEERKNLMTDSVFYPAENRFSLSRGLEDHNEGDFAWTNTDFQVRISNPHIRETGLTIRMHAALSKYLAQNPDLEPEIEIYLNGDFIQNVEAIDGLIELDYTLTSKYTGDDYTIEIKTNCYFNPKEIGESGDNRNLSLAMVYIGATD